MPFKHFRPPASKYLRNSKAPSVKSWKGIETMASFPQPSPLLVVIPAWEAADVGAAEWARAADAEQVRVLAVAWGAVAVCGAVSKTI
jgi:hypothetical protein